MKPYIINIYKVNTSNKTEVLLEYLCYINRAKPEKFCADRATVQLGLVVSNWLIFNNKKVHTFLH